MKKTFLVVVMIIGFFSPKVNAASIYYENPNGVILSKEEYDFLSLFYFDGYQDYMTLDEYESFKESNIINGEIKVVKSAEAKYVPQDATNYSDGSKDIKLVSSCQGTTCTVSSTLTWMKSPSFRSYDLFGVLTVNTNIISRIDSYIYKSSGRSLPNNRVTYSNAFSSTYKLPASESVSRLVETYTVQNTGRVITSYQHAINNVLLESSGNYLFATNGCGGVFVFHQNVRPSYDCMLGVYLDLA